jgi:hypothetical protein
MISKIPRSEIWYTIISRNQCPPVDQFYAFVFQLRLYALERLEFERMLAQTSTHESGCEVVEHEKRSVVGEREFLCMEECPIILRAYVAAHPVQYRAVFVDVAIQLSYPLRFYHRFRSV